MKKIIALLSSLTALFTLVVTSAHAAQFGGAKVSSNTTEPSVTATHTYSFTMVQTATVMAIKAQYCDDPSGGCTAPTGMQLNLPAVVAGSFTGGMAGTSGAWTVSDGGTENTLTFSSASGTGLTTGTVGTVGANGITNPSLAACHPANNGSDNTSTTCYIRMTLYSNQAATTELDSSIASFTVSAAVTVSARVDPTFTFVVAGRNNNTVAGGITTSVTSAYNTLPFGNLSAGVPKYAAHQLNVTTNTQNGYTVGAVMRTQITGSYTANNVDPFVHVWGTPAAWSTPTGTTPNDNTGWFGGNTTDTDVTGWGAGTGKFGGIGNTEVTVMQASSSDNGTVPVYVTYALEANVFQPADTYQGVITYSAVPTY